MGMQLLNMPKRDSALDTIAKGLGIAKDIYGISTGMDTANREEERYGREKQKAQLDDADRTRLREASFYPNELAELGKTYDISNSPSDAKGRKAIFEGTNANDPNSKLYFYFRPTKSETAEKDPKLALVTKTDANGDDYQTWETPALGKVIQKPKAKVTGATANIISEAQDSLDAIDALEKEYVDNVANQTGSGISQYIPGTKANMYMDHRNITTQKVGKFQEGGKMTDADREYYLEMHPTGWAPKDKALKQFQRLREMTVNRRDNLIKGQEQAGYRTGNIQAGANANDQQREEQNHAADILRKRAQKKRH